MNQRTVKLLRRCTVKLIEAGADKPSPPTGKHKSRAYNHATNLKRKLQREWNKKPRDVRFAQRLGLIRVLVEAQNVGRQAQ